MKYARGITIAVLLLTVPIAAYAQSGGGHSTRARAAAGSDMERT